MPSEHIFAVSAYVAKTVLSCIGDLFSGAKDIMDWLTTSARLVARSIPPERVEQAVEQLQGSRPSSASAAAKQPKRRLEKELMTSVIWTTPLGLPVVQPYRKAAKKQVMTALQSVYIADPNAPAEVSPQKQATAFPPNFIHSLDATHMLLTAYQCKVSSSPYNLHPLVQLIILVPLALIRAAIRNDVLLGARLILDPRRHRRAHV